MSQAAARRSKALTSPIRSNVRLSNAAKLGGGGSDTSFNSSLETQDHDGNTPLHLASRAPQVDAVLQALLQEYGPGVNEWVEIANAAGRTALHVLCEESMRCAEEMHSGEVGGAFVYGFY
jgi:hypothetical protein